MTHTSSLSPVRKHRAPKGALRLRRLIFSSLNRIQVRKHRAPKGALRPGRVGGVPLFAHGQKAPSAKRCIKTLWGCTLSGGGLYGSESTERQKVH